MDIIHRMFICRYKADLRSPALLRSRTDVPSHLILPCHIIKRRARSSVHRSSPPCKQRNDENKCKITIAAYRSRVLHAINVIKNELTLRGGGACSGSSTSTPSRQELPLLFSPHVPSLPIFRPRPLAQSRRKRDLHRSIASIGCRESSDLQQ